MCFTLRYASVRLFVSFHMLCDWCLMPANLCFHLCSLLLPSVPYCYPVFPVVKQHSLLLPMVPCCYLEFPVVTKHSLLLPGVHCYYPAFPVVTLCSLLLPHVPCCHPVFPVVTPCSLLLSGVTGWPRKSHGQLTSLGTAPLSLTAVVGWCCGRQRKDAFLYDAILCWLESQVLCVSPVVLVGVWSCVTSASGWHSGICLQLCSRLL